MHRSRPLLATNCSPHCSKKSRAVTGLRSLLASLVDYAGLFPPSSLTMPQAVANYLRYRSSPEAWMLGRFIVPAARLDEFEEAMQAQAPVPVSALAGANLESDVERIARARMKIDAIEIKAASAQDIDAALAHLPPSLTAYFEVSDLALIPVIRKKGGRAKIRTGGVTPEAFPDAEFIAAFLEKCAQTGTAFKATAGLHHPLRCDRPLTYSKDAPHGWMFGFLNVFVAAVFARKGLAADQLVSLLLAESAHEFRFTSSEIDWRGQEATQREIVSARRDFATSFGSCSFEEPVEDLKSLGLL
jgi:hypothetical protein